MPVNVIVNVNVLRQPPAKSIIFPLQSVFQGHIICFSVTVRCGQKTSENNTYFQSSGTETGACNAKVCAKSGVCQLRLDFPKFDIAQPSNSVALAGEFLLNGAVISKFSNLISVLKAV